jgi:hypothetical protein
MSDVTTIISVAVLVIGIGFMCWGFYALGKKQGAQEGFADSCEMQKMLIGVHQIDLEKAVKDLDIVEMRLENRLKRAEKIYLEKENKEVSSNGKN